MNLARVRTGLVPIVVMWGAVLACGRLGRMGSNAKEALPYGEDMSQARFGLVPNSKEAPILRFEGERFSLQLVLDGPVKLNRFVGGALSLRPVGHESDLAAVSLGLSAKMPGHGHGFAVPPILRRISNDEWRVSELLFHMTGEWDIYIWVVGVGARERVECRIVL